MQVLPAIAALTAGPVFRPPTAHNVRRLCSWIVYGCIALAHGPSIACNALDFVWPLTCHRDRWSHALLLVPMQFLQWTKSRKAVLNAVCFHCLAWRQSYCQLCVYNRSPPNSHLTVGILQHSSDIQSSLFSCAVAGKPALTTLIPPCNESLIVDYQSANAKSGFYPNEEGSYSSKRRSLLAASIHGGIGAQLTSHGLSILAQKFILFNITYAPDAVIARRGLLTRACREGHSDCAISLRSRYNISPLSASRLPCAGAMNMSHCSLL